MEGMGYQERVKEEKAELQKKILGLKDYIEGKSHLDTEAYADLDDEEQALLDRQLAVMTEYSQLLDERIEYWNSDGGEE
jgi:hypothetical protein